MTRPGACITALLLALAAQPSGAEQPLGRLFFTPEQRARMDQARLQQRGVRIEETAVAPPPANITLNGMITRGDGKTVVWINNKVQSVEQPGHGNAGQLDIPMPDTRHPVRLKVGQSLDMSSGKVDETYRRKPPEKPRSQPSPTTPEPPRKPPGQDASPAPEEQDDAPASRQPEP